MTPIKLHDLKPAPGSKTAKTRVGRGEGSKGKTAGRGTKGTKGGDVGVDELVAAGAVRKNALVKVLGDGKLTVKVNVTANKFSGSAREKITAAGGSATEL